MSEFRIFSFGFCAGFLVGILSTPFEPHRFPVEAAAFILTLAMLAGFGFVATFGKSA